jgi:hypothetical protein
MDKIPNILFELFSKIERFQIQDFWRQSRWEKPI